jgi:hypothetical protein
LTNDATDDSADLLLWDIAEACVTMVAICIPILRTMFIELDVFGLRLGRKGTNITDQSVSKNGVLTIASKRTLKSTTSDTWHEDV